jgi:CheY-like chemotaxis protein
LLVDDNSVNLKMLGMFVNKCGIPGTTSTSVRGGKEAITAFEEANAGGSDVAPGFDIIFMDLSMPDVSGFDAAASIRRIEAASQNYPSVGGKTKKFTMTEQTAPRHPTVEIRKTLSASKYRCISSLTAAKRG